MTTNRSYILLLMLLSILQCRAESNIESLESKRYLMKYLKEIFIIPTFENKHIYILQSIRCSSCADHSFDYIIKNESPTTMKIFIITNTLREDYLKKLEQIPNTIILKDTNQSYLNYGITYSKDIFLNINNDSIINSAFFINPKKLKGLTLIDK